jgi:cytochrome c2
LLNANQEWTQQRLREFLADPQARFPGTAMPKFELSQQEIEQLVTYLANPPEQDAAR